MCVGVGEGVVSPCVLGVTDVGTSMFVLVLSGGVDKVGWGGGESTELVVSVGKTDGWGSEEDGESPGIIAVVGSSGVGMGWEGDGTGGEGSSSVIECVEVSVIGMVWEGDGIAGVGTLGVIGGGEISSGGGEIFAGGVGEIFAGGVGEIFAGGVGEIFAGGVGEDRKSVV